MSNEDDAKCCFCRHGMYRGMRCKIAFRQRTDRGYVYCDVSVPVESCDHCGAKRWGETAEDAINEAVRREYGRIAGDDSGWPALVTGAVGGHSLEPA